MLKVVVAVVVVVVVVAVVIVVVHHHHKHQGLDQFDPFRLQSYNFSRQCFFGLPTVLLLCGL